jgi:membrane-bound metal-dependent hydrolase YbcI (DUF457 family)
MLSKAAGVATLALAALVFVQLILGGATLVFVARPGWVDLGLVQAHVGLGHSIWLIAIVPAVFLWRVKPPSWALRMGGVLLVVLGAVQANVIAAAHPWGTLPVMAAHGLMAAVIFTLVVALPIVATYGRPKALG